MAPQKIQFEANLGKALEAILYVLNKKSTVNMYNLMKVIFEADKFHLNTHGRPVTGDTYIKMTYGTVPSTIYDMAKQEPLPLAQMNLEQYPYTKVGFYHLKASRQANLDLLSESDLEALEHGIKQYLDLDFKEVEKKNHEEHCWLEAELNRPISFESMISNEAVLKELQESPLKLVI